MKSIFISHSTKDKDIAIAFIEFFEKIGCNQIELFCTSKLDTGIEFGNRVFSEIRKKIKSTDIFLCLLTPASLENIWMAYEIGYAECCNKRIIPIAMDLKIDEIPNNFYKERQIVFLSKDSVFSFLKDIFKYLSLQQLNLRINVNSFCDKISSYLTKYEINNEIISSICGKWHGTYEQKFKRYKRKFSISLQFYNIDNKKISCCLFEKDDDTNFECSFYVITEKIFYIHYDFGKRMGGAYFSLFENNSKLKGYFSGYGTISKCPVGGSFCLRKVDFIK